MWLVLALALAFAWRRWQPFVLVLIADAAADGFAALLKDVTNVRRPAEPHDLVALPHSRSFPSGHTATSFACATMFAFLVPRAAPLAYLLAAAIGYSRLYVGVHWPTDVIAGAAVGAATALLLLAAVRTRSARALRRG